MQSLWCGLSELVPVALETSLLLNYHPKMLARTPPTGRHGQTWEEQALKVPATPTSSLYEAILLESSSKHSSD